MRAVSFEIDGRATYGRVRDDRIVEASAALRRHHPDLRALLAGAGLAALTADAGDRGYPLDAITYLPTIPNPDKVLCVGINYRPHVEETGMRVPAKPVIFVRFAGSQTGHRQPLIRPRVSDKFDFEGELAVIIGRKARQVGRESALDYVAGFTCFMDGTVRDWQAHSGQFTPGKNFQRSGAMGPWLVGRDAVSDCSALALTTRVNERIMQEGNTGEMIFDVPSLIEYCSAFAELLPGDVIATGTPGGVGVARKPPVWLEHGDRVSVTIDEIGALENPVQDEARA